MGKGRTLVKVKFILYRNIKSTKYENRHQENYVHHFINGVAQT